jgi:exonuclease VII large subunit
MVRMGNPELLLKKGYALIEVDGRIVASVDDRKVGDALTLRLHRHALRVEILEKRDRSSSDL